MTMTSTNDLDLLREFIRAQSQDAFTALVQRHLGLVYCAALRQVRSPQLAEEVAQSVFTDLARNAARLKPDTVLTAWLYEVTRRTAINVVRGEARRQLREQIALEMNAMNATADDWTQIEPLLDDAMHALDDLDRTAILLRFFENKSLREVGESLGTTDDTARKRVNRAVERLREFFAKRGVTVGASGLSVLISTNAVLVAPAGLSAAIIAATSAITGATIATTAAISQGTLATMNLLNAKAVAALLGVAVIAGSGTYFVQQQKLGRAEAEHRALLASHEQQAAAARDAQLAALRAREQELENLRKQIADISRLQKEIARLRRELAATPPVISRPSVAASPVAVTTNAIPTANPIEPGKYVTKDQLRFGGYGTPEAAQQSMLWAQMSKNYQTATNSWSPEMLKFILEDSQGEYEGSFSEGMWALTGMQVVARKTLSHDRVELKVKVDIDHGPNQPRSAQDFNIDTLVKVGNEWKLGAMGREYTPDWDQNGNIQTFSR
jgi:RNA polymerase sigma factor (sigma-70 family)